MNARGIPPAAYKRTLCSSSRGVPTLVGGTYPGGGYLPWWGGTYSGGGVPSLGGGYLLWGRVPTLGEEGTYPGGGGVPTLVGGYLLW